MSEVRRHTRGGKRWVLDENNGDRLLGMVERRVIVDMREKTSRGVWKDLD